MSNDDVLFCFSQVEQKSHSKTMNFRACFHPVVTLTRRSFSDSCLALLFFWISHHIIIFFRLRTKPVLCESKAAHAEVDATGGAAKLKLLLFSRREKRQKKLGSANHSSTLASHCACATGVVALPWPPSRRYRAGMLLFSRRLPFQMIEIFATKRRFSDFDVGDVCVFAGAQTPPTVACFSRIYGDVS